MARRLSQQYLETLTTGVGNKARLSQTYLEIVSKGIGNKARVSQMYLEVVYTLVAPPPPPPLAETHLFINQV